MAESNFPFDYRYMNVDDCWNRPDEAFANDIIFILCRYAGLHNNKVTGHINSQSPVTQNVHYAAYRFFEVLQIPRRHDRHYLKIVTQTQSKEQLYDNLRAQVFVILYKLMHGYATEFEVVGTVTRAVMLGVDYYLYGCHNAIRFVHNYLLSTLKICNRRHNYHLFSKIALATLNHDYS